jgi:hypothetical protein
MLAGTIGSRPTGTPANTRARTYIVDQLRLFGFDVRVQETDARRGTIGRTARVANIIAVRQGRRPEAIGLLSHYDSTAVGPGAADDALGVSVSLEAARALGATANRQWTVMVLVTDGEEANLMGAAALMTDRFVIDRLRAYVNIEATGSAGPPMLFEVGPGNAWLLAPWIRRVPGPRGGSFITEIYRRLPNDTDFSILKQHEIPGLNFAAVNDSYAYHTPRDTPDRLSTATLRQTGEQVVAILDALDDVDITQRSSADYNFVDIAGTTALSYGPAVGRLLAVLAIVAAIVAWVRMTAAAIALQGVLRWLLMCVWTLIGSTAAVSAMIGATWALRAAREVYHPWYARPRWLFLLMLAAGATAGYGVARLGQWLPARAHGVRHPVNVWTVALPFWIVLTCAALWLAPGAGTLWVPPLLVAGVLLAAVPAKNAVAVRIVSLVILGVVGALWIHNTVDLLHYVVALFGRLPLVTPVIVYGALMALAGVMLAPPLLAIAGPPRPLLRPALATAVGLLAIATTAGAAYLAPAYTNDRPLRRHLRVVHEGDRPAQWEVASVEPGLDLNDGAPTGWAAGPRPPETQGFGAPFGRLTHPFVFHASGPAAGPVPITIASVTLEPLPAGHELVVSVTPRHPGMAVSFVMPAGLQPARASLPGVPRLGRWTATYVAPPLDGVNFRASFGQVDVARLKEFRVVATVQAFAAGWTAPAWLPQDRTVWTGEASWIVAPFALPIAPVPPLR